jgi:hypothetical protein
MHCVCIVFVHMSVGISNIFPTHSWCHPNVQWLTTAEDLEPMAFYTRIRNTVELYIFVKLGSHMVSCSGIGDGEL